MTAFGPVLEAAGRLGLAQLALAPAGLIWALVVAYRLARGRRVAPALATAPLAVCALVVMLAAASAREMLASPVAPAEEARALGLFFNNAMLTLTALPTIAVLALGGLAGGIRGPRTLGPAVWVSLVAGALAACMPLLGLMHDVLGVYAFGRAGLYACGAIVVAGAFSGAAPPGSAREPSVIAAVGYLCGVAAVETLLRTIGWIHCVAAAARLEADQKGPFLSAAAENFDVTAPISWAAIGLAAVPLGVAAHGASRTPTTLLAAAVPLAWLAVWVLADPAALIAMLGP